MKTTTPTIKDSTIHKVESFKHSNRATWNTKRRYAF